MRLTFANLRCAIDVLRGRMPGALAMMRARDISISVHHKDSQGLHYCRVEFDFENGADASMAYRAVERLYEMNRPQTERRWSQTSTTVR